MGSLLPNTPGDSVPGDAELGGCVPAECPEIMLFGSLAPGCCRAAQTCGGGVQIAERSWLCLSPDDDRSAEALRVALTAHAGEPLVAEPSCPSQTLAASTLVGCCIAGGTCGVSTEPWTAAAAELGLQLPSACILATEAAEVAGTPVADAGPPPACAGPVP